MSTARKHQLRHIAMPLMWLLGAGGVIALGFQSDAFLPDIRNLPRPPPYPIHFVLVLLFLMTSQAVMVYFLLRPRSYRHSWGRALLALIASVGFLQGALLLGGTHIPSAYMAYLLWTFLTAIALLVLFFWSVGNALLALARRQDPEAPPAPP